MVCATCGYAKNTPQVNNRRQRERKRSPRFGSFLTTSERMPKCSDRAMRTMKVKHAMVVASKTLKKEGSGVMHASFGRARNCSLATSIPDE